MINKKELRKRKSEGNTKNKRKIKRMQEKNGKKKQKNEGNEEKKLKYKRTKENR